MLKLLLISFTVCATLSLDDAWWYDQGHDWATSDYFNSYNPFYQTFKQVKAQMDMFGYAKHVGKINRGQFLNPELIQPGHRAFGFKSDFNLKDTNYGAFSYKPQGQKFRAKQVHVNVGLASKVGEIGTMPIGQHVQNDGTVLVQTSKKQSNPCSPNPCTNTNLPRCEVVHDGTAKCSRTKTFRITLDWEDPDESDAESNALALLTVPSNHDGSACETFDRTFQLSSCGMRSFVGVAALDSSHGSDIVTLTTLCDGTDWEDYTYQVLVAKMNTFNPAIYSYSLDESFPVLAITDDVGDPLFIDYTLDIGRDKVQEFSVPQHDGVVTGNPDDKAGYFFGCFRSREGILDPAGAGFYNLEDYVLDTGFKIFDAGLCNALL